MNPPPAPAKPFAMFLNPDYGHGTYRRRVRLQHLDRGQVMAEMEDDNHGFRLVMRHDGQVITGVDANPQRVPMSTCTDAGPVLQQLVGAPLSPSPRALAAHSNPRQHCTHQFDLLSLAVPHALRDEPLRQYDLAIHDERDGAQVIEGDINGQPVFRWTLAKHIIQTDGPWQGVSVQKGFATWAEQHLPPEQLELALVLQRGMLVSTTRRVLVDPMEGMGLVDDPMTKGVCYSYNEPAIHAARRLGNSSRNFTDTPEQLLRFS